MNRRIINRRLDKAFKILGIASTVFGLLVLVVLFVNVFLEGRSRLTWDFFSSFPSRKPELAGILSALVGTIWLMVITGLVAIPLGIGAGIYLEEYAKKNRLTNFIEINIANLAGVPSIIYGLLGLGIFVRYLKLDRSILAGGFTLALLVLPVIILSTREALRAIPFSIREASYALGATKWQTVRYQLLPASLGNIMTGIILAMSRAVGETAPLITIGALTYIAFLPQNPITFLEKFPFIHFTLRGLLDPFTALPIQIFNWVSRPQKGFSTNAAAGIIVLLGLTLAMNAVAIILRHRYQKKIRW
ncbi:MAG: phosphate ABC transporter permease PstA [Candidatus Omnitrophica bacterium]|nr:phosphate ABC transporter permease PstA [Candidatus Omnitrophota bacterium]